MNTSLAPELRAAGLGHAFMEILDAFPEEDVIGSGLVTLEEAERLFAFYHSHFAGPTYGLLDRRIHTVSFVRSRSAFLLLVVCLIAARHADWAGHLCEPFHQRMRETVSDGPFLFGGRRSVELVAAILLASNYKRGAGLQVLDQSWQAYGIACPFIPAPICVFTQLMLAAQSEWRPTSVSTIISTSPPLRPCTCAGWPGTANASGSGSGSPTGRSPR